MQRPTATARGWAGGGLLTLSVCGLRYLHRTPRRPSVSLEAGLSKKPSEYESPFSWCRTPPWWVTAVCLPPSRGPSSSSSSGSDRGGGPGERAFLLLRPLLPFLQHHRGLHRHCTHCMHCPRARTHTNSLSLAITRTPSLAWPDNQVAPPRTRRPRRRVNICPSLPPSCFGRGRRGGVFRGDCGGDDDRLARPVWRSASAHTCVILRCAYVQFYDDELVRSVHAVSHITLLTSSERSRACSLHLSSQTRTE